MVECKKGDTTDHQEYADRYREYAYDASRIVDEHADGKYENSGTQTDQSKSTIAVGFLKC